MSTLFPVFRSARLFTALAALLFLAACDSADPIGEAEVTLQGRVTTDAGYANATAGRGQSPTVEGAVVTAATVSASGQTTVLSGQATTDAEGRFALTVPSSAQAVVVRAEREAFRAAALVEAGAATGGSVQVPPMTEESTAEADVFLQARARSSAVTVADVAAHVTARTAAAIRAGQTTADQVAAAIVAHVEAEARYTRTEQGGGASEQTANNARAQRVSAYASFRSRIAGATSVEARRQAVEAFEEAYAGSYAEVGLTARHQAQASVAGSNAAVRFSGEANASFAATQQARIYAAMATALAVEQEFRAGGASQARLNALAQARAQYVAAVRAATSAQAAANAAAAYRSAVRTELTAEANLSTLALEAAFAATTTAHAALDASVAAATSAQAVAQAYATFFAAAQAAAQASLGGQASFAAEVVALLSVS